MDVEKLIEDVARAIMHEWANVIREGDEPALGGNDRRIARSAILATLRGVREADEGMKRAAYDDCGGRAIGRHIPGGYTAMIDHLIKTVEG